MRFAILLFLAAVVSSQGFYSEEQKYSRTPLGDRIDKASANEKTKGLIKNAVSEDSLDKDTTIALCNVIYFKGNWQNPFMIEDTEEKDFHVNASVIVKKPMMHLEDLFFYYEHKEIGARMIELPYQESGLRMIVILPNEIEGLASVLEKMSKKGFLEDVFALVKKKVNLYMPKFDINSKLDYKSILPKLGVKKIFAEEATGIVNQNSFKKPLSKSTKKVPLLVPFLQANFCCLPGCYPRENIYQNLFTPLSYQPRTDFIVDHPFLFAVLHEDVILFTGIYSQ